VLIATWNVNSIRTRIEQVKNWLNQTQTDVLCVQETKVEDSLFPLQELENDGYSIAFYGQKAYNGVAIISRLPMDDIRFGFSGELSKEISIKEMDHQKRIISCLVEGIRIVNVYVPNGSSLSSPKFEYKLKWLNHLKDYLKAQSVRDEPICLLGDFNIALEDRDIHDPERFKDGIMATNQEREALKKILGNKLNDVFRVFEQDSNHWSWWDYRSGGWQRDSGWRIDHIYLNEELMNRTTSCSIHKAVRGNIKPSDHAPVSLDIDWPFEEELELSSNELFF